MNESLEHLRTIEGHQILSNFIILNEFIYATHFHISYQLMRRKDRVLPMFTYIK